MQPSPDLNPDGLLKLSGSCWQPFALQAAVKLDLFTILGKKGKTRDQAAAEIKADKRALAMLLNALTAMGLLHKKDGLFTNTRESLTFLSKKSPGYVGHMIKHHHYLVESWSRLDQAVLTGNPQGDSASHTSDEDERESFLMGMFNTAMATAPVLAASLDLSGRKRLLDLGGGPGTYAIHFCMENPGLEATILDLPTTRPFAEKTIARFAMEKQVSFQDGNFVTEPVTGSYDAVWISHILHGETPEDAAAVIEKAASVLSPGGKIFVHDFILDNTRDAPLFPALFSLNMLVCTEGGQAYSENEIFTMLEKAGIVKVQRIPFKGPTDSGIIMGHKP